MITIKLSRDEASALCKALRDYTGENKELVESARYKIFLEPDDTIMFMELDVLSEGIEKKGGVNPKPNTPRPPPPQGQKETPPTDEELEEMGLEPCPQCDEVAWDGYICQVCGAKEI